MPLSCIRRFQSITSAAPTSTFFGSQPRRAHVPPNGRESTMATWRPALWQRLATADAAEPVPITVTSNFRVICFVSARARAGSSFFGVHGSAPGKMRHCRSAEALGRLLTVLLGCLGLESCLVDGVPELLLGHMGVF